MMFDFSFTEMLLVGLVALIVLGPERLPKVARFVGEWVGKIQRMAANVKSELATQSDYAELAKIKHDVEQAAQDIRQDLQSLEPAWERLPEQRTPADFGVDEMGQPLFSGSLQGLQVKSLKKQAMSRKRDLRPRFRPRPKFRSKK